MQTDAIKPREDLRDSDGSIESAERLTCQVNVRMTETMRDELESRARDQWTSASQIARLAVARELDRLERVENMQP